MSSFIPMLRNLLQSLILLVAMFISNSVEAQPYVLRNQKPYSWMIGVSWTAVDDDGRGLCQAFDVAEVWNYEYFPTRIFVDKYLKHGLSVEFSAAYVTYRAGKLINDSINRSGIFLSMDLNCKYSFYPLISQKWLDPYVSLGVGNTQRTGIPQVSTITANIGLGVNMFFYRGLGVQLQTSGKIALTGGFFGEGNYIQHNLGLVYKFNSGSRGRESFSKKRYKWTGKKVKYKGNKRGG